MIPTTAVVLEERPEVTVQASKVARCKDDRCRIGTAQRTWTSRSWLLERSSRVSRVSTWYCIASARIIYGASYALMLSRRLHAPAAVAPRLATAEWAAHRSR